ncbi:hypothetical protein [Vibrio sp. LaRot3]|uniref:hypothetical protein n=1 Tax=Vibrio sp. LaRot3 TaxID=2998829 RepID=UPI0022CDCD3C|nr:hypothetical protein [Vibrio sp. LaRot3]MDA0149624.1 hypothetical protein [Vibrio sp. LaRot3]
MKNIMKLSAVAMTLALVGCGGVDTDYPTDGSIQERCQFLADTKIEVTRLIVEDKDVDAAVEMAKEISDSTPRGTEDKVANKVLRDFSDVTPKKLERMLTQIDKHPEKAEKIIEEINNKEETEKAIQTCVERYK